jgi:hypothetical protein
MHQGMKDETCPAWRHKKKHLFVLSNAGKPIFSRYGDVTECSLIFH